MRKGKSYKFEELTKTRFAEETQKRSRGHCAGDRFTFPSSASNLRRK